MRYKLKVFLREKKYIWLYLVMFSMFLDHSPPVYSSGAIGFIPKNKSFMRLTVKEGTDSLNNLMFTTIGELT